MVWTEVRVLADDAQADRGGQHLRVDATALQRENAVVSGLEPGELRFGGEATRTRFMQRSEVESDTNIGLVQVAPGLRIQPRLCDAAVWADYVGMGEANRQRTLRCRIER